MQRRLGHASCLLPTTGWSVTGATPAHNSVSQDVPSLEIVHACASGRRLSACFVRVRLP